MKNILMVCAVIFGITACNTQARQKAAVMQAKQQTIDSIAFAETIKKRTIDSMNTVAAERAREKKVVVVEKQNAAETASATEKTQKGWSTTLKGAVIGAGAGAVTGAMVDKKKGEGAIAGGVLGAGAGAGVGAIIDHKKKKKN